MSSTTPSLGLGPDLRKRGSELIMLCFLTVGASRAAVLGPNMMDYL